MTTKWISGIFIGVGIAIVIFIAIIVSKNSSSNNVASNETGVTTYPFTKVIEITKEMSGEVAINPPGTFQRFSLVAGAVENNVPFNAYYSGIGNKRWTNNVPAYDNWTRLGYKPVSKPGGESVRFCLPPDAPMKKAEIYYIIDKER